jgi:hypothetical protein
MDQEPLHAPHHVLPLDEAHLHVYLRELWLTIGPEVLVPEAFNYLEVAVKARDHEYLLEELRGLGQRVEVPGVQSARDEKIPRPLGGALGKNGCLYFKKTVL